MQRMSGVSFPMADMPGVRAVLPSKSARMRLFLAADVDHGPRVHASGLIQRSERHSFRKAITIEARPISHGRDAELVEHIDVTPHAAGGWIGRRRVGSECRLMGAMERIRDALCVLGLVAAPEKIQLHLARRHAR